MLIRSLYLCIKPKHKMDSMLVKSMRIAGVVTAYWSISISLVFLNKYLLSSPDLKLEAPLFITWFQCIVTVAICGILSFGSKLFPHTIKFPEFVISPTVMRQVLPLSVIFVGMITFNNLCLKYVGVSFYNVGRSLTMVFNVILSYFILAQTTSWQALVCCAVVVGGFCLGVNEEGEAGSLSIMGVMFGVCASLFVALNSIYTKKVLPAVDESIWRLALYNNINASLLFIPLMILSGEVSTVIYFDKISNVTFWFFMFMGGLFGFAIGYVTGMQIQVTSPLTHNISGTAKACFQTFLATMYFREMKSVLWWFSNFVVIFGSGMYTYVRQREMQVKHAECMQKLISEEEQKNTEKPLMRETKMQII